MEMIGNRIPASYDWQMIYNSSIDPSTLHVNNTGLDRYFTRYLLQDLISQFEWTLPKNWDRDYFLYVLYCWGFITILNTNKFGIIPQACGLKGYDVFYRPREVVVTNPVFDRQYILEIGKECMLLKLQPDFGGCMDLIKYYSNLMAIVVETASTNIFNSKLSYVFRAKNKTQAESFKKMFDSIASGQPAVFIDKMLGDSEDETASWDTFTQDLKNNYIATDLLADLGKIRTMFETQVGIPNANTDKRERLLTDEINANNFATRTKAELWLEELKKGLEETRDMFGFSESELNVDFRAKPEELGQEVNDGNYINTRSV